MAVQYTCKQLRYRAPALQRKRMRVGNLGVYIATYTAISGSESSPFLDHAVLASREAPVLCFTLPASAARVALLQPADDTALAARRLLSAAQAAEHVLPRRCSLTAGM